MAKSNPNDNTQLGTGELISNEAISINEVKLDEALPSTVAYKIPRSKIAVGPYGEDWGDVGRAYPLAVDSYNERVQLENNRLQAQIQMEISQHRSAIEGARANHIDVRGRLFEGRGSR